MDHAALKNLFDAQNLAVRLVTFEEASACGTLYEVAAELELGVWKWTGVDGLRRIDTLGEPIPGTTNAAAALKYVSMNLPSPAMVIFLDLCEHLDDKLTLRALREFIEQLDSWSTGTKHSRSHLGGSRLVMVDHRDAVPGVIGAVSAQYHIPQPDDAEIESIVKRTLRRMNDERPLKVAEFKRSDLDLLVQHLRGLSRRQVAQCVAQVAAEGRELSPADLKKIAKVKRSMLQSAGVLEPVDAPTSMNDIGGLTKLKSWLDARTRSFEPAAREFGLKPPRGVLLLGVQGAGKSLAAKAIATAWTRPLMRLDPGALYDKFIGESESRLRDALRQAEAMSPVVLWIDEIEKGFASAAGQSSDGGLSRRMFGTLLTWMQEHTHPVFLVATANDIEALPPELLRKGRFDEIFFVDLPSEPARREVFAIHLRRRKQKPEAFDLDALAKASAGFSGAEIEQAILAGLHTVYASKSALTTHVLIEAIAASPPLSVTMRERIDALRAWARGRCVPAD
jgi:SpoVK/Ycf46/Vps4 family AAA+-type ATPase